MDVSIIIVNYNTKGLTSDCIESIYSQTRGIKFEIIVVDNGSSDGSQFFFEIEYPNVILIKSERNLGFGRANNEGFSMAQGRNLFFLNPDTVLLNNAIKLLSDYIDNHSDVGIVGGNLYDKHLLPAYSFRHFTPSIFWELNDLLFSIPEKVLYNKNMFFNNTRNPIMVGYITGADLMISRRVFEQVSFFSPEFFLYFEETDLAFKVQKLKLGIVNIPDAKIVHFEGESFNIQSDRNYHYLKGKLTFYQKNYTIYIRILLHMIIWLTLYTRITIFTLLLNRIKAKSWKALAMNYYAIKRAMKENRNSILVANDLL